MNATPRPRLPTRPDARRRGLTLLEVLLALAMLGVVTAALTTLSVSSLQQSTVSNARTEAAQVLNYFGRRVVGGDNAVLPDLGETLSWDYGELGTNFADLVNQEGLADPDRFRAEIVSVGDLTFAGVTSVRYDVGICFRSDKGEACVTGVTVGPIPMDPQSAPPLPGVN